MRLHIHVDLPFMVCSTRVLFPVWARSILSQKWEQCTIEPRAVGLLECLFGRLVRRARGRTLGTNGDLLLLRSVICLMTSCSPVWPFGRVSRDTEMLAW